MASLPTEGTSCAADDCGEEITSTQGWIYHSRLGVYVHTRCVGVGKTVQGEDISNHTVTWGRGTA